MRTSARMAPIDRFSLWVQKGDGCWLWIGGKNDKGYGRLYLSDPKRVVYAHRFAWAIANGPIPDEYEVCHRCDNPPCVRPDHLFLGTHLENMQDMVTKGRYASKSKPERVPRGVRVNTAKLNDIGREYGVTHSVIQKVVVGRSWAHVQDELETHRKCVMNDPRAEI